MPRLVLGPLLRYAGEHSATVWVETDAPCEVRVLDAAARTFTVHGRHYALVGVEGLAPGEAIPYEVHLDGERVWPDPGLQLPPSVIRTQPRPPARLLLAFGSCRMVMTPDKDHSATHGVDALHALAVRGMADPSVLPQLLFLAGDQVYADEATRRVESIVHDDYDGPRPPHGEVADYEEYARMYGVAWFERSVRWLLSTVPTVMVFDDHDIRDDWNTSQVWREKMRAQPWWKRRITAGLGSYLIYQHLGNLDPEALAQLPVYRRLLGHEGDAGEVLDAFAREADERPEGHRWSYRRSFGDRLRLVVLDTRAGRVLEQESRAMLDATEWDWVDSQLSGDVDHLLIGSSLPFLLPPALHDAEAWDEALAAGAWGPWWAWFGEKLRQGADLEHWAAFQRSFTALANALQQVAAGQRGSPPATVALISGDVHYSYAARAHLSREASPVWQLVCSPLRNPLGGLLRYANIASFWRRLAPVFRTLRRRAGVPDPPWSWHMPVGPWFGNSLCTVVMDGRFAAAQWNGAVRAGLTASPEEDTFKVLGDVVLSEEEG